MDDYLRGQIGRAKTGSAHRGVAWIQVYGKAKGRKRAALTLSHRSSNPLVMVQIHVTVYKMYKVAPYGFPLSFLNLTKPDGTVAAAP